VESTVFPTGPCRVPSSADGLTPLPIAASNLGLLSMGSSTTTAASAQNRALKESILHAARGEIETTARLLSQIQSLQDHVNPPYLRGDSPLTGHDLMIEKLNEMFLACCDILLNSRAKFTCVSLRGS